MSVQDENFKSKPTNFRLEKCLLFGVTLIPAVVFKKLRLFYKIFLCPPPRVLPFKSTFNLWKYEHICIHFISMIELIKLFHLCVWGKNITFCNVVKKTQSALTYLLSLMKIKKSREREKYLNAYFTYKRAPLPLPLLLRKA